MVLAGPRRAPGRNGGGRIAVLSCLAALTPLAGCSQASDGGSPDVTRDATAAAGNAESAGGSAGVAAAGSGSATAGSSGQGGGDDGGPRPALVLPIVRGDLHVLEFGKTTFVVDGTKGARITAFTLDGTNILTGPNVNALFWGSTFWTAPETDWVPPNVVANIDNAPYVMSVGNDSSITAQGPTADVAGKMVAVTKHFAFDPATSSVTIDYSLTNKATASFQLGHWEVTRVPPGGLTLYPAGTGMAAYGPIALEKVGGYYWFDHTKFPAGQIAKSMGDDVGSWVAHVMPDPAGDLVLIKVFPDIPPNTAPPGHGEISIFAAADRSYVEVEDNNRLLTFTPGQSIPWQVRWYLRRLPPGTMRTVGNQAIVDFILKQPMLVP